MSGARTILATAVLPELQTGLTKGYVNAVPYVNDKILNTAVKTFNPENNDVIKKKNAV